MEQNKQNKTKQRISLSSGRIQIDNDSLVMLIDKSPFYFYESLIMLAFLVSFFYFKLTADANGWIVILLVCGLLAFSLFTKRRVRCLVDKKAGKINYFRAGVLGSEFDQKDIQFSINQVKELVMKRHIVRWSRWSGDTFQIAIALKNDRWLELTDKYLDFSECQSNAEIIRNFIDPTLPIKAED